MSAELMKSKFVRRPSVRRPSVRIAIISEPDARISFKFLLLLPLSHMLGRFWIFEKKQNFFFLFFYEYFSFSSTWDPMGVKISKRYSSYKLQITAKSFQTSPEFSSQWFSQNYVWDFWNSENWNFNDFFFVSLTWDPMGAKISNPSS